MRFFYFFIVLLLVTVGLNAQTLSFTDVTHSFFTGVDKGNVEFVDIDGDNDMDIFTTGYDVGTTNLYINDGNGIFEKDLSIPFSDMYRSKFALADFDNDNDIDIIISGKPGGYAVSKVYQNDGSGNFALASTSIQGLIDPFIKTADIDGDGYIDFYIHGRSIGGTLTTKLYKNNGNFNFVEVSHPFPESEFKGAEFSDIDGDGDMDILMIEYINGWDTTFTPLLFTNDGAGNYTQINGSFPETDSGYITFGDIDGDNDEDVIINKKIYKNNGSGVFSSQSQYLSSYKGKFTDMDNDGDIDYIGTSGDFDVNDGNGNFTLTSIISMEEVSNDIDFADVNNDGLKDIFIMGHSAFGNIAKLYINHGNTNFSEHLSKTPFRWLFSGGIDAGDINGDTYNDVVITGISKDGDKATYLYINDGDGEYSQVINTPFNNFGNSNVEMVDIDNDNDLDIFITGNSSEAVESKIYKNDGNGNFTEFSTNIIGMLRPILHFIDIDEDSDLDLFIIGENNNNSISILYENDGNGVYTENTSYPFPQNLFGDAEFFDVDGDGDLDALFSGWANGTFKNSFIYENDGNGNFTLNSNTGIAPLGYSTLIVDDVDGDSLNDVYISGSNGTPNNYIPYAKMYHNNGDGMFTEISDWLNINVANHGKFVDIDLDNDLDLYLSDGTWSTGNDGIYINDGSGSFSLYTDFSFQGYSNGTPIFVDIDGDNDDDLLQYGLITSPPAMTSLRVIRNNFFDNSTNSLEKLTMSLIKLYPNPTNSILKISNKSNIEISKIMIFNIFGQQISEQNYSESIDLSNLKSGVYFLRLENQNGNIGSFKIIKK